MEFERNLSGFFQSKHVAIHADSGKPNFIKNLLKSVGGVSKSQSFVVIHRPQINLASNLKPFNSSQL